MKFQELDLSKKIRLTEWSTDSFVIYNKTRGTFIDDFEEVYEIDFRDIVEGSWVYYEDPKKKYWLWDTKEKNGMIFKSGCYVDDEGIGTNGKQVLDPEMMFRKHNDEFLEV